ncbi:MAG: tRNA/rRNA methyltransferase [Planctomycetota bacterium]|nr:MAG: tRNA/rRNA methyltransferase [Planctomycetota bacterium]
MIPPRDPRKPKPGPRQRPAVSPTGKRRPVPAALRQQQADERKVCGLHACLQLFERRPEDIIRVYLTEDRSRNVPELLRWCAQNRRAYNVVAADNLERLSGSNHHEGIMLLARRGASWSESDFLQALQANQLTGPLLYLDGVQNPHNVGALLRTAAHFGVAAILGEAGHLPEISAATARVAEGGAEHVPVVSLEAAGQTLMTLRQSGYTLLATSSHQGRTIYEEPLSPKTVFILGGELKGVSSDLLQGADRCVQIPGTGHVESLNVSVAGAILLSEWRRQTTSKPRP